MLTDENIIKLHKCKKYKSTNRIIRNINYALLAVMSNADNISLETLSKLPNSVLLFFIKILWFILKYCFITREMICCRVKIIESVLNTQYRIADHEIIKSSSHARCFWMELNTQKLDLLKKACIDYLDVSENRDILMSMSDIEDKKTKTAFLQEARKKIDALFNNQKNCLINEHLDMSMLEYLKAFDYPHFVTTIQSIHQQNAHEGNLTTGAAQSILRRDL